jgi:hypothetical protein
VHFRRIEHDAFYFKPVYDWFLTEKENDFLGKHSSFTSPADHIFNKTQSVLRKLGVDEDSLYVEEVEKTGIREDDVEKMIHQKKVPIIEIQSLLTLKEIKENCSIVFVAPPEDKELYFQAIESLDLFSNSEAIDAYIAQTRLEVEKAREDETIKIIENDGERPVELFSKQASVEIMLYLLHQ